MLMVGVLIIATIGCGGNSVTEKPPVNQESPQITTHPVFYTTVSRISPSRPAILVDLRDASEDFIFTAELYLSVQSSRFPADTLVVMPLNVGDFAGVRKRFVQLPFEVEQGDTLVFNLLDNDKLNHEQEQLVLNGCRACGYCLLIGGAIYNPPVARLARPVVAVASEILGESILNDVSLHGFENFGTAEYIVPRDLPADPQSANQLDIISKSNYAPASLKIFGSRQTLEFTYDET